MNKHKAYLIFFLLLYLHPVITASLEDVASFIRFCYFNKENPEYANQRPSQTQAEIIYWLSLDAKNFSSVAFISVDLNKKLTKITIPQPFVDNSALSFFHNKAYKYLEADIVKSSRAKNPYYKTSKIIQTQYGEMTTSYDGIYQSFSLIPTTPLIMERFL